MAKSLTPSVLCCELANIKARLEILEGNNPIVFLPDINSFDGSTPTDLDSTPTFAEDVPKLFAFVSTDVGMAGLRIVRLRAGTDAQALPAITRPDDYDAGTNAKVFESVL